MDPISRRQLLKAGNPVGGVTTVGLGSPSEAWAWNPRQSVAGGDLETIPPDLVWDDGADPVVRRLFEEEGIARIEELNALLRPWHRNDQELPSGLPADLVAFI